MERQTQHIVAERSILQHKTNLLQTQIENRNKEMKRLHDMHSFKTEQQNAICEKERNDLLQTISSKDETLTEVQTQYESLKQRFEHLRSVLEQIEKNQSRLLEKFSTQSTQCMNVINMMSELCNKGKGNVIHKLAQEPKKKVTSVNTSTTQSNTSVKATVSTFTMSTPREFYKTNRKQSTDLSSTSPPSEDILLDSDHNNESSLKALQKLQHFFSGLNSINKTINNKDEIVNLKTIQNSTEENVFKSQTGEGGNDDETSDEKDLHKNMAIKETTEQQTGRNKKLPALNETSESEHNQTRIKKVNDLRYPMLLSKNESPKLANQNSRTADRAVSSKKDPIENITLAEEDTKSNGKSHGTGNNVEVKKMPQRLTLEKIKTPDGEIYKPKGESEHENKTKDEELNDQEISEIIL